MPMGMAPIAHVLWSKVMQYSATNPKWLGRDRFVLSNGHGCALLYSMLHLAGYKVSIADLKQFRQLGSITPGHPESHMTPGVEVTTGPLGQGIANAVGLAIAECHLAAVYNRPGFNVFDNYTYAFCGDGCMQEGVSGEAASLAGHLGLGKLILMYDDNGITIDGETGLSFSEDVPARFRAYGWHTITVANADADYASVEAAIAAAQSVTDRPSLISCKLTIGFGAKNQGEESVHGSPLGDPEIQRVKAKFGLDPSKKYHVPADVAATYAQATANGQRCESKWNDLFSAYSKEFPQEAAEITRRFAGKLPAGWKNGLPKYTPKDKAVATRKLSGAVLNAVAKVLPELVGGSADLTPSNKTALKCTHDFVEKRDGRYLRYGVREHGMAAINNGLVAYGGIIPFGATFLNFIEYAFPAVRLSALSEVQQIYIMTHDSIALGEDGPTHQPIEAMAMCRATPNVAVVRPADGNEVVGAYVCAVENRKGPTVICCSRQALPHLEGSYVDGVARGGYVLRKEGRGKLDLILVASGSEVSLALAAADELTGLNVRVVSMPACTNFDKQSIQYRRRVLPVGVPTLSIEAACQQGWERYSHFCIGMTTFGASAPGKVVMREFGFTPDQVAATTRQFLAAIADMPVGLLSTHLAAKL
eukprot:CAMPEP_0205823838 /NCGR_PEP_ID=MMETSP0206-20130828/18066_1 /ASSEMBLY_ACC=CAM_ASM_000279 /TAXON_ID=36767 /ORGANISM="Euplotes focardii, Strain TN1" /LENGTH=645 /DNA_ID=CAMNT_0053121349 /DNA_START=106 /DNA_END=2043 /DNA_ORIENTATION=+